MNRWLEHCISVLDLQMALTAISLPFIIGYGLPISIIAVIGNVLFGPFLTVFLLLASLLFVTQLLHIPNACFVVLLEWCNALWAKLLSFTSSAFLVSVPTMHMWSLALLFVVACLILCFPLSKIQRLVLYLLLLFSVLGSLKLYAWLHHDVLTVKQGAKCLTFVKTSDQLVCIDGGVRNSRGLKSWFFYTVLPEMRKQLGTTSVTTYVALHPNKGTPELCRLFDVQKNTMLVMPDDEGLGAYAVEHGLRKELVTDCHSVSLITGSDDVTVAMLQTNAGCYALLNNNQRTRTIMPRLRRSELYKLV